MLNIHHILRLLFHTLGLFALLLPTTATFLFFVAICICAIPVGSLRQLTCDRGLEEARCSLVHGA